MEDRLSFRAGRVVQARGWDAFEVIESAEVAAQTPGGPPLLVLHRAPKLGLDLCRNLAALNGSGRTVLLVSDATPAESELSWLAETELVGPDESFPDRQASPVPAMAKSQGEWPGDSLSALPEWLDGWQETDDYTAEDGATVCELIADVRVRVKWDYPFGMPVELRDDPTKYKDPTHRDPRMFHANEHFASSCPTLLTLPLEVAGTSVFLVAVLGGTGGAGFEANAFFNVVGLVTARVESRILDPKTVLAWQCRGDLDLEDLLPWLTLPVYTRQPFVSNDSAQGNLETKGSLERALPPSQDNLRSEAVELLLTGLAMTAHGLGLTILRHGCESFVTRREEVQEAIEAVPGRVARMLAAELGLASGRE